MAVWREVTDPEQIRASEARRVAARGGVKLSPRDRLAMYRTGHLYGIKAEDLSDEIPLTPGTLVVLTKSSGAEGQPGTIVEVEGDEGDPCLVAVEYLVAFGSNGPLVGHPPLWFRDKDVKAQPASSPGEREDPPGSTLTGVQT
jgi:hypothetical protein